MRITCDECKKVFLIPITKGCKECAMTGIECPYCQAKLNIPIE